MKSILIFILSLMILITIPNTSYAHEKRTVAGQYEFIVGFVHEPAFSGQMNGVDLRVLSKSKPVEGLEQALQVTIMTPDGKQSMDVPLRTVYKEPGKYAGYFLPAQSGKYVFLIKGEIRGTAIDERFESGEKFHDVEDSGPLRFPPTLNGKF